MSSILAIDPEILLIGLAMPLGVALIGGIVALWMRKNGREHAEHVRERRLVSIDEKLDEILETIVALLTE